jgi:phosphoesterase RecJ-like protein
MSDKAVLLAAATALEEAAEISLACHVGPDGDALGSMLGLAEAASNAGKIVKASFGSPFIVPDNLSFLPTDYLVAPGEMPAQPDVLVVLDVGSADRLGELASNAGKAEIVVVLDHHVTNAGFGDIAYVDPTAAATGEIVFDLLELSGWDVTPSIANSLLTAVVTDTGRFQYSNTTPRTLEIAAALVEAGAVPTLIGQRVYEEAPFGYLIAAGAALSRAELNEDLSVVSTVINEEDLATAGVDWGDIDGLIDTIRLAREADTAVLAKAHGDGRVKISMRSRGATDVGSLAVSFGGGGHRLAAGFTSEGDPLEVVGQIVAKLGEFR